MRKRNMSDMEKLKQQCLQCENCGLAETRINVVFGVGNPESPLVFVGEGPGEQEDLQGEPFVGPAGQLLDIMLEIIGLDRSKAYICNIVKCRPPKNRDPYPEEREACKLWLDRQLEILSPRIIVCLGRIAAISLIDPEFRITRQHGQWFSRNGIEYTAIYHPAALLRDAGKRPETFVDLKEIRRKLDAIASDK